MTIPNSFTEALSIEMNKDKKDSKNNVDIIVLVTDISLSYHKNSHTTAQQSIGIDLRSICRNHCRRFREAQKARLAFFLQSRPNFYYILSI